MQLPGSWRLMLHAALTVIISCCYSTVRAQVQIGSAELSQMNSAGSLSTADYEALQKSTILFVVQGRDAERIKDFERRSRRSGPLRLFASSFPAI